MPGETLVGLFNKHQYLNYISLVSPRHPSQPSFDELAKHIGFDVI